MSDETLYALDEAEIFVAGIPHPEGVAFDRAGWLYTGSAWPDFQGAGPIYRVSPDGKQVERFADTGGRVLGLAFDRSGQLFVCDVNKGAVFRISPAGEVLLFADQVEGRPLQKPNFLVFDQRGGLFVSDSGTAKAGEPTGAIYYFEPGGAGRIFRDQLIFPNGLALNVKQGELLVVLTRDNSVLRIPLTEENRAGQPVVLADNLQEGPDGVALDVEGNVYVTVTRSHQIVKIAPDGRRAVVVKDPAGELLNMPSNVAFGGAQNKQLYIANLFGDHITRLQIQQAGSMLF